MTETDDNSEYDHIIDRVQAVAAEFVTEATKVATTASEKITKDEYTARDLILTMTEMVRIAATNGAEIVQRSMTDTPPGLKQVADYSRADGRRFLQEARDVSLDATRRIDAGTYDVDDMVMSMTRLVDHAIIDGLEVAQTLLSGPGRFDTSTTAIPIELAAGQAGAARTLTSVTVCRHGDKPAEFPLRRASLTPPSPNEDDRKFILTLHTRELPSAVYTGTATIDGQTVEFEFSVDAT